MSTVVCTPPVCALTCLGLLARTRVFVCEPRGVFLQHRGAPAGGYVPPPPAHCLLPSSLLLFTSCLSFSASFHSSFIPNLLPPSSPSIPSLFLQRSSLPPTALHCLSLLHLPCSLTPPPHLHLCPLVHPCPSLPPII